MATTTDEAELEKGLDATPSGQAQRWQKEFKFADEKLSTWKKRAKSAMDRFLDVRNDSLSGRGTGDSCLNLYTSNVQTMRCIMYGKTPKVDASRRFADSADDIARVSAEILERYLNTDIQKDGDTFADACGVALDDRLIAGGGFARVRYVAELEDSPFPEPGDLEEVGDDEGMGEGPGQGDDAELEASAQPTEEVDPGNSPARKKSERVETDYVHWRDFKYSPGRTWADTRWVAFLARLDRKEAEAQFGADVAAKLPFGGDKGRKGKAKSTDTNDSQESKRSPWGQVVVWEIWSKEDMRRYFYCEGYGEVLVPKGQDASEDGGVDDPYGLDGFFPCPRPMLANTTSEDFVPVPDLYLWQDLVREIDSLQQRILGLEEAIVVRGIYDKTMGGVEQLLNTNSSAGNLLIPVSGMLMSGDKSLASAIQWMPLDMVVAALDKLRDVQREKVAQFDQVSGVSDIIRGEAAQQTTATEQSIKARFASVRIQAMQDEFARFCSDLQRLKAEIISKHFDAATLLQAANMQFTLDAQQPGLLEQAVQLIKSDHFAYRVEVKPESVSLTDYAALKSESMEVLQGIGGFLQMAAPLAQMQPAMGPMLLQLLQWTVSRIRGSQEIEGLLDKAITQAQQAAQQQAQQPQQPPPPNPKLEEMQTKAQLDAAHTQRELQADMTRAQVDTQASRQQQMDKAKIGLMANAAKERAKTVSVLGQALGQGRLP